MTYDCSDHGARALRSDAPAPTGQVLIRDQVRDIAEQHLKSALDVLGRPFLAYGPGGTLLHRNAAIATLLASEPGRDLVTDRARELAAALLARTASAPQGPDWSPAPPVAICPHRRSYTLSSFVAPPGTFAGTPSAVVVVERSAPRERFSDARSVEELGLTRRQAQVAKLLLAHYSAPEIARALTISVHTARRHVEQVYRRTNVSGREQLVRALSAGVPSVAVRNP